MREPAPTREPLVLGEPGSKITSPLWLQYFQQLIDFYNDVLRWIDPKNPNFGRVAPTAPPEGLLAYADGVNWDAGGNGQAGYYLYNGINWQSVGMNYYFDVAGSGRKWYINGVSVVMGTDSAGNPMEYSTLDIKEV